MDIRYKIFLCALLAPMTALAAPVVNNDVRTVPRGIPITIDVLNNDFDDTGDTLTVVADAIVQPANGRVVVNSDGGITYTPNAAYIGPDQFLYTVQNSQGQQGSATVSITVVSNLVDYATNDNGRSVVSAIESICASLSGLDLSDEIIGRQQLAARCEALLALRADESPEGQLALARALEQIAPEETLSLTKVGSNASQLQTKMVSNRLMQLGSGIGAAAQGGLTWNAGRQGAAAGDGDLFSKIGFFASLQLEDAEKDRSASEAGFDYSANGLSLGADYAFSQDWFVGGAFGLTKNDLDYKNNGGKVQADIYTVIIFSTYHVGNFNFDAQLGGGNSNVDIARYMNYSVPGESNFTTKTDGQTSGSQWFLSLQTQYTWSRKALTLFPSAKINYTGSRVKGYADNNASGWEVVLDDQKIEKFDIEAGVQATYAINTSWGVVIPNADFTLYSNLNNSQDTVSGYFAYAPTSANSFALDAEDPDSLYYQLGVGSSVIFPGGNTGFIGLRKTLGYDDFTSLQLQAGMRMEF